MKEKTCCFTGHRNMSLFNLKSILERLSDEIDNLYNQGITNFVLGGAVGFDYIAATRIIKKRYTCKSIRLILVLPCKDQDKLWHEEDKALYSFLLESADDIIYVSDKYYSGCMKKRNYRMVEMSAYCICALINNRSGTAQTVRRAKQKGLKIINVAMCGRPVVARTILRSAVDRRSPLQTKYLFSL